MSKFDTILIPGGGVREGGALPQWVVPRFERALELAGPALFLPLSAGTPHRAPPLDETGFPWTEARAGGRYLVERGVAPERILLEESSFDTIGNAYFSLAIHSIPRGFERILVVTSAFHMPRTEAIFRWVYGIGAPACAVEFETVPDTGMDPEALAARIAKEQASLAALAPLVSSIRTLAGLHAWLFREHSQYACRPHRASPPGSAPLY